MIRTVLALMVVASLVAVAGFLLLARDIYVVESGSMSPTLHPGDAVVVKALDGPAHPGQVITFEMQGKLITHRVTRVGDDGVHVKGDALDEEDPWTIPPAAVRGEMDFRIPYVGYLIVFLRQPAGWLSLVVLPALLLFAAEVRRMVGRSLRGTRTTSTIAVAGEPSSNGRPRRLPNRVAVLALLLAAMAAFAALAAGLYWKPALGFFSGTRDESLIITTASFAPIAATVDIDPDTLDVKGQGQPVTAYIELPAGFEVSNIQVGSLRVCLGTDPCTDGVAPDGAPGAKPKVGDADHDGIADLKVQFARPEVIALVGDHRGETLLTVSGGVNPPGQSFAGSDTIRVIDRGCGADHVEPCVEEEQPPQDAPPPEATPPPGPPFDYQVQPGDTLFDIALRFGTSVQALVQLNSLSSAQVVWAGQVLKVAATAPPASPSPPSPPLPPAVATVEYTVRPGERVWDVAAFFDTTVETIVALNGLTDPGLVVPGQRLLVPAPPAAAPAPAFTSEYVVQPGETLTDIAARFGTTVEALAAANSLANPSAIRYGDRLRVP